MASNAENRRGAEERTRPGRRWRPALAWRQRAQVRPTSSASPACPGSRAVGEGDVGPVERVERRQAVLAMAIPSMSGYSTVSSANHCWRLGRQQPGDELPRRWGWSRPARMPTPATLTSEPGSPASSEGVLRPHGVGAHLGGLLVPVVVVHQAELRLAGVDRVERSRLFFS